MRTLSFLLPLVLTLATGCGGDEDKLYCGSGTVEQDGECVRASEGDSAADDSDADDSDADDSDADDSDVDDSDADDTGGSSGSADDTGGSSGSADDTGGSSGSADDTGGSSGSADDTGGSGDDADDDDDDGVFEADDCDDTDASLGDRADDADCDGVETAEDCDDEDPGRLRLGGDRDCDGDGLTDEDEIAMGTDPQDVDSDGDGETDGIELFAGTDPLNATSSIAATGEWAASLSPGDTSTGIVSATPTVGDFDLFVLMDTTGSLAGEINSLKTSFSGVYDSLALGIPTMAMGVGRYDDFPLSPFGAPSDVPFELVQRITTDFGLVEDAIFSLSAASGEDIPESGFEALYQTATGAGITSTAYDLDPFNPLFGFDSSLGHGFIGGAGFRASAIRLVIQITDARNHNALDGEDAYTFSGAADETSALNALNEIDAYVAIVLSGTDERVREQALRTAEQTNARVLPSAFGSIDERSCAETECCTGEAGIGETPDSDGFCPLVFQIPSSGLGLADYGIIEAVGALLNAYTVDTLHIEPVDDVESVFEENLFVESALADGPHSSADDGCVLVAIDRVAAATGELSEDGLADTYVDAPLEDCSADFTVTIANGTAEAPVAAVACADTFYRVELAAVENDNPARSSHAQTVYVRVPGDAALCLPDVLGEIEATDDEGTDED
jgi:hypothetical protein